MNSPSPPGTDLFSGSVVREIRQPAPDRLVLRTYGRGVGEIDWLLSVHPACPRFLRTFRRGRNPPRPGNFCQWLRTRIAGAAAGTPEPAGEQAIALPFTKDGERFGLILECNGNESNLLLVDGERRLLIALRHPALPGRKLAPGEPYVPPPAVTWLPKDFPLEGWRLAGDTAEAEALDRRGWEREQGAEFEALQRACLRAARRERKRLQRRVRHQREDLARAREAETVREWGELLKINRNRMRPGQQEIRVTNEFLPGRPEVAIPLDPQASPVENIERLFRRYRKLRGAAPHIEARLGETEAELNRWAALTAEVEAAADRAALEAAYAQAGLPLPVGQAAAGRGNGPSGPESASILTRISSDGFRILVGRSKEPNDEVTFRIGNGRDWWFHAQGIPGAHVIVRTPSGGALPPRTLREAAWLAAYYSPRRAEGKLDIDYTQRKYVRKIKGGEPGQVTYSQNRTVVADLADSGAARVLSAVEAAERR